jgi:hypothetical protein
MVYSLSVPPSNTETDGLEYVIHDFANARPKWRALHIEQYGFVATSDIESDAARTY